MVRDLLKPPALRPGDTVAIVAPADRPHSPSEVQRAATLVAHLGFAPLVVGDISCRYSAWTAADEERAALFMRAWLDDRVRALWLLRGGWGAARLLPLLDYASIATHPKLLIANGEATGLLIAIHQRTGLATLHGPPLSRTKLDQLTRTWLLRLISDPAVPGPLPHSPSDPFDQSNKPIVLHHGQAAGWLIGGQLTELASLLATPDAPQVGGSLLFVALPPDPPYVLERHLTALRLAGMTQQAVGLILSDYPGPPDPRAIVTLSLEEALRYGLKAVECPTSSGQPIGNSETTLALPIGTHATLDTTTNTLTLDEGIVSDDGL